MALLPFIPGLFKGTFNCYGYTGCVMQGVLYRVCYTGVLYRVCYTGVLHRVFYTGSVI